MAEDYVIIGGAGVDLLTFRALVVSRIDRPQRDLTFIALIPLIVLSASRGEGNRLIEEPRGFLLI
jgi:hypothetical protein